MLFSFVCYAAETLWPGTCEPVTNFTLYYVGEYGPVAGALAMKQELFARGPISCGIDATTEFESYSGGIYSQNLTDVSINHEIAVVGWGLDSSSGTEYWIGRNSWGMYWGEEGFFQMEMYQNNLGIETDCSWGIPSWEKP
ncbi:Papain family cysteine protease containing protein [Reticulomyxa filosa]|uniref:Papain family cysteine protease containing protein n=1 Tax=Reticulomyxa filosa TaxID=46433 RepID=X6M1H0_RETFI|nr:Papain family cysteine protease containing protein [Reticulomyxa filosa]|eukprot:ETO07734.1 Papain family cysteine protease containing protein [Reticulomyxa filosa]